jgi:hypothetical protein
MKLTSLLLILPLALSLGISSCVGPGYVGGVGYGGGYNSYTTLPRNYIGSAYNHNGRYYSGGNYQTGSYSYQGRPYTSRYSHNGQYYYGGSHQNYSPQHGYGHNAPSQQNQPFGQILPRHR